MTSLPAPAPGDERLSDAPTGPSMRMPLTRRALRYNTTRAGVAISCAILLVALIGPFFAKYSPDALVGAPFDKPSSSNWLGLDYLGRDGLSRFLNGGRTVIALAAATAVIGELVGLAFGLASAYARNWTDGLIMRACDVLIAIPAIILVLVLASVSPTGSAGIALIVIGVALAHAPRVARLVRGAALEIVEQDYVAAAEARGDSTFTIIRREILPNIAGPVLVDFGLRLAGSLIIVSGLAFLGLGLQPPQSDWGLMINENRSGLLVQPYVVLAPAVAIALLTVGVNLVTDGIARALGREDLDVTTRA